MSNVVNPETEDPADVGGGLNMQEGRNSIHRVLDLRSLNLTTIQDFDLAASVNVRDTFRVGSVPRDVTMSEVNLITWMILEQELMRLDNNAIQLVKDKLDVGGGATPAFSSVSVSSNEGDSADGGSPVDDPLVGFPERLRRRTVSHSAKARRYAEELLRQSGMVLPFQQLTVKEKKNLFQQLATSSEFLREKKFNSISEVFDALRTRSKLKETFEIGRRLGGGNYGDVFEVIHRQTKMKYAAKRVSLTLNSFEEMRMTINESRILRSVNHENIVHCLDAWLEMQYDPRAENQNDEDEPLKFYVLMDFCHQTLHQWILDIRQKPNEREMTIVFNHTLSGLKYIHSKKILHFDINTYNLMWADPSRTLLKIGDFGLAIKGDSYPYPTGTPPYAAPDAIFTSKSDIYSFGVTLLQVAENIATTAELVEKVKGPSYTTSFNWLNDALPLMLHPHSNKRPSAAELQTIVPNTTLVSAMI